MMPSEHEAHNPKPELRDIIAKGNHDERKIIFKWARTREDKMKTPADLKIIDAVNDAIASTAVSGDTIDFFSFDKAKMGMTGIAWQKEGFTLTAKTTDVPRWLRSLSIREALAEEIQKTLDTSAKMEIHIQGFRVLAMFTPTHFDPNREEALRMVEEENGWRRETLTSARFIKPVKKRAPGQAVAHMTITCSSREDANEIIHRFDTTILGRSITTLKELPEATRCMNCQAMPRHHNAADCPNPSHCERCDGPHRIENCKVWKRDEYKCTNCKVMGHGAADRECPYFIAATEKIQAKIPGSEYRYYPTEDSNTWVRTEPRSYRDVRMGRTKAPAQGWQMPTFGQGAVIQEERGRQKHRKNQADNSKGPTSSQTKASSKEGQPRRTVSALGTPSSSRGASLLRGGRNMSILDMWGGGTAPPTRESSVDGGSTSRQR